MVNEFRWKIIGVVALFGPLGGCTAKQMAQFFSPTLDDVKEIAKTQGERLAAHDTNITEQHKLQTPELADEFDTLRGNFEVTSQDLDERIENLESSLKPLIEKGLSGVLSLVWKFTGIDLPLIDMFKDIDTDTSDQDARLVALNDEVGDVSDGLRALKETMELRLRDGREDVDELAERTRELLQGLNQQTRDKFAQADRETIAQLNELKDDRDAFMRELQTKFDLTEDQMQELEGLSPGEIMALIAAAGAGLAGGRTGRSRSQPTVDDHERRLARVENAGGGGGTGARPAGGAG